MPLSSGGLNETSQDSECIAASRHTSSRKGRPGLQVGLEAAPSLGFSPKPWRALASGQASEASELRSFSHGHGQRQVSRPSRARPLGASVLRALFATGPLGRDGRDVGREHKSESRSAAGEWTQRPQRPQSTVRPVPVGARLRAAARGSMSVSPPLALRLRACGCAESVSGGERRRGPGRRRSSHCVPRLRKGEQRDVGESVQVSGREACAYAELLFFCGARPLGEKGPRPSTSRLWAAPLHTPWHSEDSQLLGSRLSASASLSFLFSGVQSRSRPARKSRKKAPALWGAWRHAFKALSSQNALAGLLYPGDRELSQPFRLVLQTNAHKMHHQLQLLDHSHPACQRPDSLPEVVPSQCGLNALSGPGSGHPHAAMLAGAVTTAKAGGSSSGRGVTKTCKSKQVAPAVA